MYYMVSNKISLYMSFVLKPVCSLLLSFWRDSHRMMKTTLQTFIRIMAIGRVSRDHRFIFRLRIILRSKVCVNCNYTDTNILCLYNIIKLFYICSVIVTEKTTILLRYLHQQWDKKVKRNYIYRVSQVSSVQKKKADSLANLKTIFPQRKCHGTNSFRVINDWK